MKKLTGFLSLLLLIGCAKEYSIEGVVPPGPTDTVPIPPIKEEFPVCPACLDNTIDLWEWSFKSGNSTLCGVADTAIMAPQRTAFTFFGPSSCSGDTGMVISVYLNEKLDKDITNLADNKSAFYYYDRVTPSYIFMSQSSALFTVTITSYVHQTRIATGTFQGHVVRANGTGTSITTGKFKVKLI